MSEEEKNSIVEADTAAENNAAEAGGVFLESAVTGGNSIAGRKRMLKDARRKFAIIGLALLAFIGIGILFTMVLPLTVPSVREFLASMDYRLYVLLYYTLLYGVGFLLFFLVIRRIPADVIPKQKMPVGTLIAIYIMAYPLTVAGSLTGTLFETLIGQGSTTSDSFNELFSEAGVLFVIMAVFVAPVVEELVFRRMIIDRTRRYGEKAAILFSALCFGIYHRTIPQLMYATVLGLAFGYVYSKSGKIHYTMIMHAFLNGFSTLQVFLTSKSTELAEAAEMDPSSSTLAYTLVNFLISQMGFAILGVCVLGIVFLCKKLKKARFEPAGPYCIPRGRRFTTMWLNWGMFLFVAVCLIAAIVELLYTGTSATDLQYTGEWICR